ncbi:hypothetical protein DPMN_124857 [Dreissena polymorpha]|uniref:Uncharacterized protein n=1 Tax=Dreissena polymorpha TaxID=45954 RepID=A0A9D4GU22_DREPO|nr:hypothetical protein DPMN_124857 [Dreissena polymorpha]
MWLLNRAVYYHMAVVMGSISTCDSCTGQYITTWFLYREVYRLVNHVQGSILPRGSCTTMWLLYREKYYHAAGVQGSVLTCVFCTGQYTTMWCCIGQFIAMWLLYRTVHYHLAVVQGSV